MAIRVVLAEDSLLVREGVRSIIAAHDDLDLVGVCEDYDSLVKAVEDLRPDVLVTDIRMPPTQTDEGIRVAEHVRAASPETGVVVLSQYDEADYALALLDRGSQGRAYLLKQGLSDPEQLVAAIRTVARGGSVIDPRVIDRLVGARARAERSPLAALSERESQVLAEMAQGKSNAAIAAAIGPTERAIERHVGAIFTKLGMAEERDVNRRVKAVLVFLSGR